MNLVHNNNKKNCPCSIELSADSVIAGHLFIVPGLCGCVCLALCVR